MSGILGKAKKEPYDPEMTKALAAEAAKKKNPNLSKRKVKKIAKKVDKHVKKRNKLGL